MGWIIPSNEEVHTPATYTVHDVIISFGRIPMYSAGCDESVQSKYFPASSVHPDCDGRGGEPVVDHH